VSLSLSPLPEPPADAVAQVLDELRTARRELADASRIVELLSIDPDAGARAGIESLVALRRVELWTVELRSVQRRARSLGLDVTSTL